MARFNGNIFNRALGSIGGQTFSQARDRRGKVQTGRQRVAPANPKTSAQQEARQRIGFASNLLGQIPAYSGSPAWSVLPTHLPNFQKFQRYFIEGMVKAGIHWRLGTNYNPVNCGDLHFPSSVSVSFSFGNHIKITWSTEKGTNGHDNDQAVALLFQRLSVNNPFRQGYATEKDGKGRVGGSYNFDLSSLPFPPGSWNILLLFHNTTHSSAPSYSKAKFFYS